MSDDIQAHLDSLRPFLVDGSPHAAALGFQLETITPNGASIRAPYREDLIGDPETRVLHGGVVTALLDHACGMAAFAAMGGKKANATLDLRLDYMRPARPGEDVLAEAECVKVSGLFAFVSAIAHDGNRDDPVARATAAFMVTKAGEAAAKRARAELKAGASPISQVKT
jgi:uncharacterized protein (TIGR00369 family)